MGVPRETSSNIPVGTRECLRPKYFCNIKFNTLILFWARPCLEVVGGLTSSGGPDSVGYMLSCGKYAPAAHQKFAQCEPVEEHKLSSYLVIKPVRHCIHGHASLTICRLHRPAKSSAFVGALNVVRAIPSQPLIRRGIDILSGDIFNRSPGIMH